MKKIESYQQAIEELEQIVSLIESEDISVDELSEKVKRATQLINYCKDTLFKTEKDVKDVLRSLITENDSEETID